MREDTFRYEGSVELTDAEIVGMAKGLGALFQKREDLERQIDGLKGRKKEVDALIDEAHAALRSRRMTRTVEAVERVNVADGLVEIVHVHTGNVLHSRAATDADLQLELDHAVGGELDDAPTGEPVEVPVEAPAAETAPVENLESVGDLIEQELEAFTSAEDGAPLTEAEEIDAATAAAAELDEVE